MKITFKLATAAIVLSSLLISSCKKEDTKIEGCTDSTAMNYQDLANSDNGSCIFAYEIAQGDWNIDPSCDSVSISIPFVGEFDIPMLDMFPENITIAGEGNQVISLDINGNKVLADVAYDGYVTIQDNQSINFDSGMPTVGAVEVAITGSGKIETSTEGNFDLNLQFTILSIPSESDCEILFTK